MMMKNLIIALVFTGSLTHVGAANQLRNHPSPYLALHGNDPVNWQEWNETTFARAKKENKLLFVSSGYFSCHWCHVMQRESFSSRDVAKLLNKHFIPVKVDRELNPALDARLIEFVERTQGHAGWPLNVFITPDGYPLIGMVYLPRRELLNVLNKLSAQWQADSQALVGLAKEMTGFLMTAAQQAKAQPANNSLAKALLGQSLVMADELQGGFGEQNKFPSVPQLSALMALEARQHNKNLQDFIQLTLEQMASQGLHDHLGGGFFRYSVDPGWQIPHFEKMLYDNALLASLYLQAAEQYKSKAFEEIAMTTLDFMLSDFLIDGQAMLASFSAVDDKNTEGGYYTWQADDLERLLSKQEFQVVSEFWKITGDSEMEGGHHLVQGADIDDVANKLGLAAQNVSKIIQSAKKKMLLRRNKRKLPEDNKQLAAWNALALSALVKGAKLDNAGPYKQAARQIHKYLTTVLLTPTSIKTPQAKEPQLLRAINKSRSLGKAGLEDYAYVATALLDWAELTKNRQDMEIAEAVIRQGWKRFYINQRWQLSETNLLKYGAGVAVISDGPMPSPSAVLIGTTLRYVQHHPDKQLEQLARQSLGTDHVKMSASPFWYASQIKVLEQFQE